MAVANVNSQQIIDLAAGLKPNPAVAKSNRLEWKCTLETAVGDTASLYRLFRVPWNIVISGLFYACDAITTLTLDVGVHEIPVDGGAVVDADEFASAAACTSAIKVWTDILFEADGTDIAKCQQPLWTRLGVSAEPYGKLYDITATAVGAPGAVGTVSFLMMATSP